MPSDTMSEQKMTAEQPAILLLEDDLLLAMDMEDHLLRTGNRIIGPFGRIADALDAIPRNELDGAIVDLNLHGELSFPVIDLLTERNIPFIVCSGYAELPEVKARLAGLPLLAKPWTAQKLTHLMKETFGERRDAA